MSEIPFLFRTIPDEFMTDEFLDDPSMMKLIRYILKRIRHVYHEEIFEVNRTVVKVKLQPYEWMFGREKASKECGISEDIIRVRIKQLLKMNFIQKIPGSSSQHFTVYRLVTESFSQYTRQLSPAVIPGSYPSHNTSKTRNDKNHPRQLSPAVIPGSVPTNERTKDEKEIFIKDDRNELRSDSSFKNKKENTVSSDELKLDELGNYVFKNGRPLNGKTLIRWLYKYDVDEIYRSVKYYEKMDKKEKIQKGEAYVEECLKKRWWESDHWREYAKEQDKEHERRKNENWGL